MNTPQSIHLIDTTVREGGFRVHHRLLPQQAADIARGIQLSGLGYIEVSHGCGIGALNFGYPGLASDEELLQASREAAPNLKYSVLIHPTLHTIPVIEKLEPLFEIGRIPLNPDDVGKGTKHIKKLKDLKKTVIAKLERIHLFGPEKILDAVKALEEMGADIVYLSDTFGSLEPDDIKEYFSAIHEASTLPLGFQGRNNSGLAVLNALTAFETGAQWLDASLLGMGPGAGVANLEILTAFLQSRGFLREIDLSGLSFTSYHQVIRTFLSFPLVTFLDLLFARHKIDFYPQNLLSSLSEILELHPEEFIKNLKEKNPGLVQLKEKHLREYLAEESLDFDVVLEYLKTGHIPSS